MKFSDATRRMLEFFGEAQAREVDRLVDKVLSILKEQGKLSDPTRSETNALASQNLVRETVGLVLQMVSSPPSQRDVLGDPEVERRALEACAQRFDFEKFEQVCTNGLPWRDSFSEAVDRAVASGIAFIDPAENFGFFVFLRRCLQYAEPPLHDNAAERTALRKLFLAICDAPVPEGFSSKPSYNLLGESVLAELIGEAKWQASFVPYLSWVKLVVKSKVEPHASQLLNEFRDRIVNGTLDPDKLGGVPIPKVVQQWCWVYGHWDLKSEAMHSSDDSIQGVLMQYYRDSGVGKIDDDYLLARRSAGVAGFDALRGLWEGKQDSEHLAVVVLAKYWVHPHCPLWLMENPAIVSVCRRLATGGGWTVNNVPRFVQGHQLYRTHYHPIKEIKEDRGRLTGFVVASTIHSKLKKVSFECCCPQIFRDPTGGMTLGGWRDEYKVVPNDTVSVIRNRSRR